jgi:hypothetical protein
MRIASWCSPIVVVAGCLALVACDPRPIPTPASDPSPPGLLAVDIKLERRDGQPEPPSATISILNADVTRKISRDYRIRVIASAGDPQSGIARIDLATVTGTDGQGVTKERNLSWACYHPPPPRGDRLVGILELAAMVTTPPLAPLQAQPTAAINVTVDPVGQASCGDGTSGLGGFVRVVATNGVGGVTASKTFVFDYLE